MSHPSTCSPTPLFRGVYLVGGCIDQGVLVSPGLLHPAPLLPGGCHQASARLPEGPRHHQTAQAPWDPSITVLTALRLPAALTGLLLASPGKCSLYIADLLIRCKKKICFLLILHRVKVTISESKLSCSILVSRSKVYTFPAIKCHFLFLSQLSIK